MDKERNYYQILHVHQDAPVEIIRSSYRTLMQRMKRHPDLGGDHLDAALINEAYAVLTDPIKRADYDRELSQRGGGAVPTQAENPSGSPVVSQPQHAAAGATCVFCGTDNQSAATINPSSTCANCGSPLCPAEKHRLESEGQRAVARIARNHTVILFTSWPGNGIAAQTQDISLNGMRLSIAQPVAKGQLIKIDGNLLQAIGRVTRCDPVDNGSYVLGVSFVTLRFTKVQGSFVSAKV